MTSPVSIHYIVVDIVVGARTAPTQSEGLVIVMDTLFDPSRARSIPQRRVIERMDAYMARRDYAGAERHLLYWLEEARALRDRRGALTVLNELVGHYRKTIYLSRGCGSFFENLFPAGAAGEGKPLRRGREAGII